MLSSPTGRIDASTLARLYEESGAAKWGVSAERFQEALEGSLARDPDRHVQNADDVDLYLRSLHLADLALATACHDGLEAAWDHFVREFRPALYRAAGALVPGEAGRELADSLYGDLFGLETRGGQRRSLFRYFHGRSKLTTWLRAVLAQRHVDRFRAGHRLDPLDDADAGPSIPAPPIDPERRRFADAMRDALATALDALPSRDRLRLSCYYVQDMTLLAIGRLTREHEATVSRHLARTRRELRQTIESNLRDRHGMGAAAIRECFRSVVDDVGDLDLSELMGQAPSDEPDARNPATDVQEKRRRV